MTSQAMSALICWDILHSATLLACSFCYVFLDFKFANYFKKNTAIVGVFNVSFLRCCPYTKHVIRSLSVLVTDLQLIIIIIIIIIDNS